MAAIFSSKWASLQKKIFSIRDAQALLRISRESAGVACHRLARRGLILRLKRDCYVFRDYWEYASQAALFETANRLQVPSYVSLLSGLAYWECTTQIPQGYVDCISVLRSREIRAAPHTFVYRKIARSLYSDFRKEKGFFIATPEKALMDSIHLSAWGKYSLDVSAVAWDRLNRKKIQRMASEFPLRSRNLLESLWPS